MAKLSYYEQLKDPRWQRLRLVVLNRDGWKCCDCGDGTTELHVHHLAYNKGCLAWEYDVGMLKTLCATCHAQAESRKFAATVLFGYLDKEVQDRVLGILCGLCHGGDGVDAIGHLITNEVVDVSTAVSTDDELNFAFGYLSGYALACGSYGSNQDAIQVNQAFRGKEDFDPARMAGEQSVASIMGRVNA